jgi:peptidoglycan DL-endopeptidase RipA
VARRNGLVRGRSAGGARRRGRVLWARLAVTVIAGAVALVAAPGIAGARPVNPSDSQLSAAQQAANDAANQVGDITAQLAAAQSAVSRAQGEANIALDRFQGLQQKYETAQAAATAASAAEQEAQGELSKAQVQVASFARDSYISGSTSSRVTGLITSGSPTQMLERAALLDAAGDRRSQVLDRMSAAQQRAAAAAATARSTLATATGLKDEAAAQLASASQQEAAARQQAAALQTQQSQLQGQLDAARLALASLQGQRAAALAYAQPASSAGNRLALAGYTTAGPPSGSAVATAITAAERWIGTMYAWGGGALDGPSEGWGIDAGVVGFDCSGLTRYAYAQAGITIPRNASAQYMALPKVSGADLQPGDLVFYAFDTSDPSSIHHVTMYLGNGQMIEAPESGERVHITAMRWGEFIGGARPSA